MPAGRPRTVSEDKKKCIELGKDLKKWATENTDEWRCLFGQWWCLKQGMLRSEWKTLIQTKEFLPYYEAAQQALAARCIDGTMEKGFGHRYIRLYDRQLVEEERDHMKFEAELKNKNQIELPPLTEIIELQNQNMELKARIAQLESSNNKS